MLGIMFIRLHFIRDFRISWEFSFIDILGWETELRQQLTSVQKQSPDIASKRKIFAKFVSGRSFSMYLSLKTETKNRECAEDNFL